MLYERYDVVTERLNDPDIIQHTNIIGQKITNNKSPASHINSLLIEVFKHSTKYQITFIHPVLTYVR